VHPAVAVKPQVSVDRLDAARERHAGKLGHGRRSHDGRRNDTATLGETLGIVPHRVTTTR